VDFEPPQLLPSLLGNLRRLLSRLACAQ